MWPYREKIELHTVQGRADKSIHESIKGSLGISFDTSGYHNFNEEFKWRMFLFSINWKQMRNEFINIDIFFSRARSLN